MSPHALSSVSGVFALLQAYAFLQYLKDRLTRQEFQTLFFLGVSLAAGVVFLTVIYLTYTGTLTPGEGFVPSPVTVTMCPDKYSLKCVAESLFALNAVALVSSKITICYRNCGK